MPAAYVLRMRFMLAVTVTATLMAFSQVNGHENHAPLPTKGVTIAGNTIMLSEKAREAIGLTTAKIAFGDIHRTVTVNARVELPWHAQAMITSLVPGKIESVMVRPGETVVPGQELARVVSIELQTLQLELMQAIAQVDLARKLVEQRTALDRQGVIPGKSLLESRAVFAEQSAALQITRQKLIALGLDGATLHRVEQQGATRPFVSIKSPIGGVITHADVRIGQMVDPTGHLYHVVDPSKLWIVGAVLESDVRLLAKGQGIEAEFAALPGKVFRGEIDHLRLKMDPRTRTEEVVIAIENPNAGLRPGMFGRVRISVKVTKDAIVCPVDAVVRSRSGNYLLVQRVPGKYENRLVKLGLVEKELVEVHKGVFPGDKVVLAGNSLLASLLGNEHKARVSGIAEDAGEEPHEGVVAVVHGSVELPTDKQALATPPIEGRIRRVFAQPSCTVAQGEVLAEIDSLELRSVQLSLVQSLAQARLLEQSLLRLEQVHDQGLVAQRQRWELLSQHQTLRLKANTLERQLAYFGLEPEAIERLKAADLSQTGSLAELVQTVPVRAPTAGQIVGFHVIPGQVVHPGEPLFEIHDLTTVWVKGFVHERDANHVQLGQPAHVHFAAYPELSANGTVVRISPLMHENMRVLPIWVEVSNPDHLLRSGMLARMTIMDHSVVEEDHAEVARLHAAEAEK